MSPNDILKTLFEAGIDAVSGKTAINRALACSTDFKPDLIIAVGKAAAEMYAGTLAKYGNTIPALIITKHGHANPALSNYPDIELIEAGHPIPDEHSLLAGQTLREHVANMPEHSHLLMLVSGGASALAENLQTGLSLADWQAMNQEMIAGGLNIAQINALRKSVSQIKGGQLLANFQGKEVRVYAISDVQGDDIGTIGSGIGDPRLSEAMHEVRLVASNQIAREAVTHKAIELGLLIRLNEESLYADVFELSHRLGEFLRSADRGLYLWGGEPTIVLPDHPGEGGRNQSLALALAEELQGYKNIHILVAGTDGTDGPTDAAGAIINGATWQNPASAQQALERANAGPYLEQQGARLVTGPTGTNVMDLLIALVE